MAEGLPEWIQRRRDPKLLPKVLADKPLPEWSTEERRDWQMAGKVWSRDNQEWVNG